MIKRIVGGIILVLCTSINANELKTTDIIDASLTDCGFDCIDWKPSGLCFWFTCTLFECSVESTLRVTHNLPLSVINVYSHKSAWKLTRSINRINPKTKGSGVITQARKRINNTIDANRSDFVDFKKADAFINPACAIFRNNSYFCESDKIEMTPLYLSSIDFLGWHRSIPEIFTAPIHLNKRVAGNFLNSWSPLYPRHGWTNLGAQDHKSAYTASTRVASLLTKPGLRVVNSIKKDKSDVSCDDGRCWYDEPFNSHNLKGGGLQMIYPVVEDDFDVPRNQWGEGKASASEQYAWVYWREKSCCPKAKNTITYLFSITW